MIESFSVSSATPVAPGNSARVQCDVYSSFESLSDLRKDWDQFVLECGSPIYMTYDWVRTWWEFYGRKRQLRILTFHSEDRLVGVMPLYIDTFGYGPLRFRVARFVGACIPPRLLHPPVREDVMPAVFEKMLRYLFAVEHCDCVGVGPVSETWRGRNEMLECAQRLHDQVGKVEIRASDVHALIHLPQDYDAYINSLGKNERKRRHEYQLRHLSKDFDTKLDVVSAPESVGDEFERFMGQHGEQWRAEGQPGHFQSWPNGEAFHRALVRVQGQRGRLRFVRITANGQVVCRQYIYALGDTYYAELLARPPGPEWKRYGLARISVAVAIQKAIEEGMTRYDAGLGHYDFKLRLGAHEFEASRMQVIGRSATSIVKARLYTWIGLAVAVGYNKLWYRRIQKRFPVRWQRPHSYKLLRYDF